MLASGLFAITLDEQAAYIIQAFAMGIAGGATRIGVFKMIDTPSDLVANPEPFGLVRADGSRRPAFDAYRTAATYWPAFKAANWNNGPTSPSSQFPAPAAPQRCYGRAPHRQSRFRSPLRLARRHW